MNMNSTSLLRWLLVPMFGLLLLSFGCSSSSSVSDHTDDDAEGTHAEHFVPAHKPADLEMLVEQLSIRTQQLSDVQATETAEERAQQFQELKDIVEWIPELAADSDLQKRDFEDAVLISGELLELVRQQIPTAAIETSSVGRFSAVIDRLRALSARSNLQK